MSLTEQQINDIEIDNAIDRLSDCSRESHDPTNRAQAIAPTLRQSNRIKAQKLLAKVQEDIEIQSSFHLLILRELKTEIGFDRLKELERQMSNSINELTNRFDEFKQASSDKSLLQSLVRELDRVTGDSRKIAIRIKQELQNKTANSQIKPAVEPDGLETARSQSSTPYSKHDHHSLQKKSIK